MRKFFRFSTRVNTIPKYFYMVYCSYPYSDDPGRRTEEIKRIAKKIYEKCDDLVLFVPHFVFDYVYTEGGIFPRGYENTKIIDSELQLLKKIDIFAFDPNNISPGVAWEKAFCKVNNKFIVTYDELLEGVRPLSPIHNERANLIAWTIAWEGSISVHHLKKRLNPRLIPKIWIHNTELELLQKIRREIGVGSVFPSRKAYPELHLQAIWELRISNIHDVQHVLISIIEYIPSERKRRIAELVLRFCDLRLACTYNAPYGKEEWEIFQEVKRLNLRGSEI